jgi:hypothetical protein
MTQKIPWYKSDCSCNVFPGELPPCCNNCGRCQCSGTPCLNTPGMREITQKRIQNQVRIPSSQYISVLSSATIQGGIKNLPINNPSKGFFDVNQDQRSDRNKLHLQTRYVPTRGNSTTSSITRLRPGSMGPAGKNAIGVDVKHNSYDRYLGRLKAKCLGANWKSDNNPNKPPPPIWKLHTPILPGNTGITPDESRYAERFSKINYGILGNGLCKLCNS